MCRIIVSRLQPPTRHTRVVLCIHVTTPTVAALFFASIRGTPRRSHGSEITAELRVLIRTCAEVGCLLVVSLRADLTRRHFHLRYVVV